MTKTNLIEKIATEENISVKDVAKIINRATEIIVNKVAEGETIAFKNFGTFSLRERSERRGNNPRTGEPIIIEAHKIPYFKAGKLFRKTVNQ